MTIYENIKKLCDEKNIPIGVLEQELDIPRSYISKWKDHAPNINTVKRVAEYLGVSIDKLLEGLI